MRRNGGRPRLDSCNTRSGVRHCVFMSLACGAFYGYNSGIVSGLGSTIVACHYFRQDPLVCDMTSAQSAYHGLVTSCVLFGGIVGSVAGVPFADRYGRKTCYIACGVIGLLTSLLGLVDNFWLFIIFRTLVGVAVGGVTVLVPLYVTEVADPKVRGSTGTLFQVSICFTILLAQTLNYVFSPRFDPDDVHNMCVDEWRWRFQFSIGVIPAFIMLAHGVFSFPESKDWLLRTGQVQVVQEEWEGNLVPSASFDDLTAPEPLLIHAPSFRVHADSTITNYSWKELLTTSHGLSWAGIGTGLACSAQLTGINAIMFYGPQIFKDSGFNHVLLLTFSVIGTWNFLSVFAAVALVDRLGRRPLMLAALSGMTASAFLIASSSGILGGFNASLESVMTITGLMGFIFFFEVGPGSLFFLLASETFPRVVRSKALVLTNVMAWVFNICISFGFPIVNDAIGTAGTFALLGIVNLGCVLFIHYKLPETSGELPPTPLVADYTILQ